MGGGRGQRRSSPGRMVLQPAMPLGRELSVINCYKLAVENTYVCVCFVINSATNNNGSCVNAIHKPMGHDSGE